MAYVVAQSSALTLCEGAQKRVGVFVCVKAVGTELKGSVWCRM